VTSTQPRKPAEHVERALCVLAHPDDVDFGSAGTVAGWTAAGTEVTYCIVTGWASTHSARSTCSAGSRRSGGVTGRA